MSQLPISPISGQPSTIRAAVEKTTYLPGSSPVWQGPGGSTIQAQPAVVQRAETGVELANALLAGLGPVFDRLAQRLVQVEAALDRQTSAAAQPAQAQQARVAESWEGYVSRSLVPRPGVTQPLPLPRTGPVGGGAPDQAVILRHQATSPGGMAAAAVATIRQGPDPSRLGYHPQRPAGAVSPRTAVRRSLGQRG